jgi:Stress responsive A/B Barrel Domain
VTAKEPLSGSFEVSTPLRERPESSEGADPGRIQHVALSWLREPDNEQHLSAWLEAATALATIPGVESLAIGPAAPVSWSDPDQTFSTALTIVFTSRDAMELYQAHPIHHEAIALSNMLMKRVYACYVELEAFASLPA